MRHAAPISRSLSRVPCRLTVRGLLVALAALPLATGSSAADPEWPPPDPAAHEARAGETAAPPLAKKEPRGEPVLKEVQSFDFGPPLLVELGPRIIAGTADLALVIEKGPHFPSAARGLSIIDRREGVLAGQIPFTGRWSDPFYKPQQVVAIRGSDADIAVVIADRGSRTDGALRAYSLEDPSRPELLFERVGRQTQVLPLPFPDLALVKQGGVAPLIIDMRDGTVRSWLAGAPGERFAVSARGESLVIASLGGSRPTLYLHDASDPDRPVKIASAPVGDKAGQITVDPAGTLVAHTEEGSAPGTMRILFRDARTAGLRSSIEVEEYPDPGILLTSGRNGPVLAVGGRKGIDLWDLSVAEDPRFIGSIGQSGKSAGADDSEKAPIDRLAPSWHASPVRPWLMTITHDGGVAVIDVDRAEELSHWTRPGASPARLTLADGEDGPELTTLLLPKMAEPGEIVGEGKDLASLHVTDEGELVQVGTMREPRPAKLESVVSLGGRYAAAFDGDETGLLLLVDTALGEVVDSRRPRLPFPTESFATRRLEARDGALLILAQRSVDPGCVIYIPVEGGRFGEEFRACEDASAPYRIRDAVLGPGPVVHWLTDDALVAWSPLSGERSELPFDEGVRFDDLELSPDGLRLLATDTWAPWGADLAVFDTSTPLEPRALFVSRDHYAAWASWARHGEAVIATTGDWGSFAPVLLDPTSGAELGPAGEAVGKWFYHGSGIEFGASRFLFWHWSFSGWRTAVYDASSDAPLLLGESLFRHSDPTYLRRGSKQAYLFAELREWGSDENTNVWVIGEDGEFTPRNRIEPGAVAALRHGYVVSAPENDLVVLRDAELNRPPVADAGPDQRVECAGQGGAEVTLDGRGSSDPDSTPGTDDDIALVEWQIDGAFAGDALLSAEWLAKGSHEGLLRLTDRLDAIGEDHAVLEVVDTLAPEVSLDLAPATAGSTWLANAWIPDAAAEDRCDGALEPSVSLVIPADFAGAPYELAGGDAPAVVVVRDAPGLRVLLEGDPVLIEPLWLAARASGRLPLTAGAALPLVLGASPAGGVVARYEIGENGTLQRALRAGPGADHLLEAAATDAEGHQAAATRSLRQVIDELCASLPRDARCRPGVAR